MIYQALTEVPQALTLASGEGSASTVLQLAQAAYDSRRDTEAFVFIPVVAASDELDSDPIRFYREVLELAPVSKEVLHLLATVLLDEDRPAEALTVIGESLAITKDSAESDRTLILQGMAYVNAEEYTNAIQAMERFIENRGFKAGDLGALGIIGLAYDGQGRTDKAAPIFLQQGQIYVGRSNFADAEVWFVRSAEAYQKLGRPDLAAEALCRSLTSTSLKAFVHRSGLNLDFPCYK